MLYSILAALSGVLIALMIWINGILTGIAGNAYATVLIHLTGLILIGAILLITKQKPHPGKRLPVHLYMGGVVGVVTVVLSNIAVPLLGVSITLALGLLGQLICSLLIDQFALLGAKKQPFRRDRIVSAALVLVGIAVMMVG